MNTNYSNRIASKLAKFSGIDLSTVQTLLANPKANKNVIKQIFTQSQKIAVAVSKKYRQMSIDSNTQLKTLRKQFTEVQFDAAVKAAKQVFQDAKNQDPFTLLGISKPNIDIQTPNAVTNDNVSQPQYYGNHNDDDWDNCVCKKKCKCEKKYYEKTGQLLKELLPCAPHIPIPGGYQPLPFVCSQPGTYCLTSNMIYVGTGSAITVASSNVIINLDGFKITMFMSGTTGIDIDNFESVEVYGGQIEGTDTSGITNKQTGIIIYSSVNVNIHDMIMTDIFNPILSTLSVNCQYEKLYMSYPAPDPLVGYLDFGAIIMFGCVNQVVRNIKTNEYSGNYNELGTLTFYSCIDTTIDDVQCYKSVIVDFNEDSEGILGIINDLINIKNVQLKNFVLGIGIIDFADEDNTFGVTIDTVSIDADDQTNTFIAMYVSDVNQFAPGVSLITIKNINISNYNRGLYVTADTSVYLDNIKVYSNSSPYAGIDIDDLFSFGASFNTIIKNSEVTNYFTGISVAYGFNNIIENTQIALYTDTDTPDSIGIDARSSTNTSIKSTQIVSYDAGIILDGAGSATVTDSIIVGNITAGISSNIGSGYSISRNIIADSVTGVYLNGVTGSQLSENLISYNDSGIVLDGIASSNTITNNTITVNSTIGVQLNSLTTGNICTLNIFTGNGGTQFQDNGSPHNNFGPSPLVGPAYATNVYNLP